MYIYVTNECMADNSIDFFPKSANLAHTHLCSTQSQVIMVFKTYMVWYAQNSTFGGILNCMSNFTIKKG